MLRDIDENTHMARIKARCVDRWCYGGSSKQETQQQSTSTNTINPQELAMLQGNYSTAQANAAKLGSTYQGQLTAGFAPSQIQAQGVLSGIATDPTYGAMANSATNATQGVLGNNPNPTITANPVQASTIAGSDLSPYMNPYQNDVINASITQNERARQIAQVGDSQQATAAGAFGGSRSGVMAAGTNEAYDRNDQQNLAALNSANYSQAQQAAGVDAATRNNMGQFNANQSMTAQQGSFNNALAGNAQQLTAASQLANQNNNALQVATSQGGLLGAVGDQQQQQQQTELSNAYAAYQAGNQLTVEQQQLLNSALGLMPNQQTVNTSGSGSTTTSTNPGVGGILGGVASLGLGVGSLGTGTLLGGLLSSDVRLKSDIETVRFDARKRRWVSWRWNWEPKEAPRHEGVIAQEVLATDPDAVHVGPGGLYLVDYDLLKEAA